MNILPPKRLVKLNRLHACSFVLCLFVKRRFVPFFKFRRTYPVSLMNITCDVHLEQVFATGGLKVLPSQQNASYRLS